MKTTNQMSSTGRELNGLNGHKKKFEKKKRQFQSAWRVKPKINSVICDIAKEKGGPAGYGQRGKKKKRQVHTPCWCGEQDAGGFKGDAHWDFAKKKKQRKTN